jgi:FAD:protein FMN transferase
MGTRFELVLGGDGDPASLRSAGEAALEEIECWHRRLNRFAEDSLVAHLRRTPRGTPVRLDCDTLALLADARAVWEATAGAFDPTAPAGVMDAVRLDATACTVTLAHPDVALDLGGIAKGHALDAGVRVLRDHGVAIAFLHGGTSSAVGLGAPPGEPAWRVALAGGGEVALRDRALSVSASWAGNPHPTLDPRTGRGIPAGRRAVVTGPSARLADAWSTAVLVMGRVPSTLPEGFDADVQF